MGIRSFLSKPLASWVVKKQSNWMQEGKQVQRHCMDQLVHQGKTTQFGRDHHLAEVDSYEDFKAAVPVRDYEQIKAYIEAIKNGEKDVLWPGVPLYFCKTSGTTSGVKYIPITKDSLPNHIEGARDALLNYIYQTGNSAFLNGKLIFLSGSPELDMTGAIPTGRLSGIVNHHVPAYLRSNQLPRYETNCMEDWEAKVDRIIDETLDENMTLISGIPPWVQMYFDKIQERTQKPIMEVFPQFSLFVYGGVNFEPYRKKLWESIGKKVDSIELYPASEGFFAFQDQPSDPGLLLLLNSGIFYEFIPADEFYKDNPTRLSIDQVSLDTNYAVIINSNAGLWGYSLGDTVKFVSTKPFKILVTGRIKHFISAFGEHVIGEEVEKAMQATLEQYPETAIVEFTVAPQVTPPEGLPLHQWFVEFASPPHNLSAFEKDLNLHLQKLNSYYDDLISGNILRSLRIITLQPDAFRNYMKEQGKLGGQNKVPRLSNDRNIAQGLETFQIHSS
ncbi:MAG: GH3 auxin-responsive promoter family protein [Cyclobacteriaceae bacterium]|nr:GH3 auxin-responsive promoter family protein [Cyclobacteriaceae bacterium]